MVLIEVDGRRLRREQNRETVLDALAELFVEGVYQPSANEIAERAGISPRSLFRYFDDIDDLIRAAIERQLAGARPLLDLDVAPGAATDDKIAAVVEARMRLFDATAPAARAARVCAHRQPMVAQQLHESRAYLRGQVRRAFAPELSGARAALFPTVDALCSFETHQLLRVEQGLSRARATASLAAALAALLS